MSPDEQHGTQVLLDALDGLWDAIRANHPDVPAAVVALGEARHRRGPVWGHATFARPAVAAGEPDVELLVEPPRSLADTTPTLETLLHSAAHGIAYRRGIKDLTKQGRYHNKRFAALAEEVGLAVASDGPGGNGWLPAGLAENVAAAYAEPLFALAEAARGPWVWESTTPRASPTSTWQSAVCACDPPRRIRTGPATLAEAAPLCPACHQPYRPTTPA